MSVEVVEKHLMATLYKEVIDVIYILMYWLCLERVE
jgi:hypothetical protein